MNTYQLQINFESDLTVDRENELVLENETVIAVVIQTQVSLIRNKHDRVIGTEVLHDCRAPDGTEFVADESFIDEHCEDTEPG